MRTIILAVLAASSSWGCGNNVEFSSGASGQGGAATSTTTGTTGTTSGAGGGCAAVDDEASTEKVAVRFVNHTGSDIYIAGGCGVPSFSMMSTKKGDLASYTYDRSCLQTCETRRLGEPVACADCAPIVWRLPNGGSHDDVWNGLRLRNIVPPPECAVPTDATCNRVERAPAGDYVAVGTAFTACPGCSCEKDATCWGAPSDQKATA